MTGRRLATFLAAVLATVLLGVSAQESINAAEGVNVGLHCGLALLVSFGILGTCTIGVNILTRYCAKRLSEA